MATITGTNGNDILNGPNGETNVIDGLLGTDTILGGLLADTVSAAGADDTVTTGPGDDLVFIDDAQDLVSGSIDTGGGTDRLVAVLPGQTFLIGAAVSFTGVETINLRGGVLETLAGETVDLTGLRIVNARIEAGTGGDVTGTAFADDILGSFAIDTIRGGAGNDTIEGGNGDDRLFGGGGADTFLVASNLANFERINGGAGIDTIRMTGTFLTGNGFEVAAVEAFDGGGFDLFMFGGNTVDLSGFVTVTGIAGIFGSGGSETLGLSVAADVVDLQGGFDTIRATRATLVGDSIDAGDATDTLVNVGAKDLAFARVTLAGIETIDGGGRGLDIARDFSFAGIGLVDVRDIAGNALGNTIVGSGGGDTLLGLGGDDSIAAGDGNDVIEGGAGADRIGGAAGADTFVYRAVAESAGATVDTLSAFVAGTDRFDLSAIDAIPGGADDAFTFVTGAFTAAGQVRAVDLGGDQARIEASTDADAAAELEILVLNLVGTLSGSDFEL